MSQKKKKSGIKGMHIKKLARDLCLLFCNMYFHVVENSAFQNSRTDTWICFSSTGDDILIY